MREMMENLERLDNEMFEQIQELEKHINKKFEGNEVSILHDPKGFYLMDKEMQNAIYLKDAYHIIDVNGQLKKADLKPLMGGQWKQKK